MDSDDWGSDSDSDSESDDSDDGGDMLKGRAKWLKKTDDTDDKKKRKDEKRAAKAEEGKKGRKEKASKASIYHSLSCPVNWVFVGVGLQSGVSSVFCVMWGEIWAVRSRVEVEGCVWRVAFMIGWFFPALFWTKVRLCFSSPCMMYSAYSWVIDLNTLASHTFW